MRYLKHKGTPIKINNETYYLKFTLDVVDELQDKTNLPIPEIIDMLSIKKYQKNAIKVLLKYLTGQETEINDNELDYYSVLLIQTYIDQLITKPFDGIKPKRNSEIKNDFEFINIERLFYIATVVLHKTDEQAWTMTIGEIDTLYQEHCIYNGWLREDKEMNIDDVIPE